MRYSSTVLVYILTAALHDGRHTPGARFKFESFNPFSYLAEQVVTHARGSFEVQVKPLPVDAYTDETSLGRMTIDKQFSGDLVGTGKGQMLTGMGSVKGSAAYSAIERVSGLLAGKRGTFVLQHTGIVTRGAQSLVITIVPDSGTDELTGITGTFAIIMEGKQHMYDLEYSLPVAP